MARTLLNLYAVAFDVEKEKLISLPVGNLNSDIRERFLPQRLLEQIFQNSSDNQKPISTPITRVSNKLTDESNKLTDEEKAKKGLALMPHAVRENYWNVIHEDDRPLKYNPLYEVGVQSGKIPSGAEFVTDIKQYALDIGFAPSDLEGSRLDLYYGRIVHGRWEEGSTLQSLKNSCNEYSKRFYKIYGEDHKPTPKQIFGIE